MKTDDYKQRVAYSATLQPTKAKKSFCVQKELAIAAKKNRIFFSSEIAKTLVRRVAPEKSGPPLEEPLGFVNKKDFEDGSDVSFMLNASAI
jgi:hypothetical protein